MNISELLSRLAWIFSSPEYLLGFLAGVPLISLVCALLVVTVVMLVRRRSAQAGVRRGQTVVSPAVSARYKPEFVSLGVGAVAIIVVFFFDSLVLGYLVDFVDVVEWWRYATPIAAAALCIAVVGVLIVLRGSNRVEVPMVSTVRRGWLSFGPRNVLMVAGLTLLALVVVTIGAGLESSSDSRGRFIYIALTVPNTEVAPVRPWFYGWSFGVPVLIALAVLAVVVSLTLRSNAMRRYVSPATVVAEQGVRTAIASAVVRIATAGMLLSLGGALRFISRGGSVSRLGLEVNGQDVMYDVVWKYSQFAIVGGWLAPLLEVAAFALLIFVALRMLPARELAVSAPAADQRTVEHADDEAMRAGASV